jgi:carbonic anhydrase/acetyltransferase-like protein (isoleucine patch superfamily)
MRPVARDAATTVDPYGGQSPRIHPSAFVAAGARIIGDVEIGEESSVWFNAVIRGDVHSIRIGRETNVQDNAVLHVTEVTHPLVIGDRVTIGHMAMLHGCTVEDLSLIGIGAIVLDGAVIGTQSFIAARALVTPGVVIPPRSMVMGSPAKVVRPLRPDELEGLVESARHYVQHARAYREGSPGAAVAGPDAQAR